LPSATPAIDQAQAIAEFETDIDGETRPKEAGWDLGADEYDPSTTDSDGDDMTDAWEADHDLDPLNNVGEHGANGNPDGDPRSNWAEYVADTDPRDELDYLAIRQIKPTSQGYAIAWDSSNARKYTVQSTSNLDEMFADHLDHRFQVGSGYLIAYTNDASGHQKKFYRLRVDLP
jgi:hypothetical protein